MKRWLCVLITVWINAAAFAADGIWNSPSGGVWSVSDNWSDGIVADGEGYSADFTVLMSEPLVKVNDPSARTLGRLLFGGESESLAWLLDDADAAGQPTGAPLVLSHPSGRPEVTVSNTTVYLAKQLAGAAGLLKTGTGPLYLLTNGVISGQTEVREGRLSFGLPASESEFEVVAYYSFDDPQNIGADSSGKGNHLSAQGTVSYSASGRFDGGAYFDGSAYLTRQSLQGFPSGDESFTMAAWVKTDSTNRQAVIGWGNKTANRSYTAIQLQPESNDIQHYVIDSSYWFTTPAKDQTSGWMHVALVYDSAAKQRTFYVNGVRGKSKSTPVLTIPDQELMVGLAYTTLRYFSGVMDDVIVTKGALSENRIRLLMAGKISTSVAVDAASEISVGTYGTVEIHKETALGALAGTGTLYGTASNVAITGPAVFAGRIEGPTRVEVAVGAGEIAALSGANSYTGGTRVLSGSLEVKDAGDLFSHVVAYYTFDDPSALGKDRSGNGNDLTIRYTTRPLPFYVSGGKAGGAVCITNDNWLARNQTRFSGLSTGEVPFTVSAWFNFSDDAAAGCTLFAWRMANNGAVNFRLNGDSRAVVETGNGTMDTGMDLVAGNPPEGWHHVTFMYMTNGLAHYRKQRVLLGFVDGQRVLEVSKSTPIAVSEASDFLLGTYFSAPAGSCFRGMIDEFVVLDRADPDDVPRLMAGLKRPVSPPGLSGLVARYDFDTPDRLLLDSSGFANHLSEADPSAGPMSWSSQGRFGGALAITNKNWLMASSFPSGMPYGDEPFSVSLWIKPDADMPKTAMLYYWGGNKASNSFRLQFGNSYTELGVGPWSASQTIVVPDLRESWHHLAVTYDPSGGVCRQSIYLNGKILSQSGASVATPGASAFRIANGNDDSISRVYKGLMDEFLLFNRALAPWEIALLATNHAMAGYNVLPATGEVALSSDAELIVSEVVQDVAALQGSGLVTLNRGVLEVSGGGTCFFDGTLSGNGAFVVKGNTRQILGSTSALFTGDICVTNATLELAGDMASGASLLIQNEGVFGGQGTVAGPAAIEAGGMLEPRFNAASLTFAGGLTMASGAGFRFIANVGGEGNLNVAGALILPETGTVEAHLPDGVSGQYVLMRADALDGNTGWPIGQ